MINKLRKKIFWIIQISLSVIILGIIIIFTSFSYKNTITSSTMFMERIERKDDVKREQSDDFREANNNRDLFLTNIDGVYRLSIENNSVMRESDDVTDEIRNYALKLSNKKTEEGYIGKYIYRIRKIGNNGKEITLIENENAIKRLKTTIIIAAVIGLFGIFIIYIFAKKISKIIVKPVEESFKKQKQFVM